MYLNIKEHNMREFKFRVWSIEEKQFISPNILEVFDESGDLTAFKYIKTGKLNPLYMPVENYIIQQYTGLTDKNKNLIYEGDIVKYITWHGRYDGVSETSQSVVRFQNGAFYPRFIEDINEEDPWYSYKVYDLKVVGNEMEHKHLDENE